MSEKFALVSLSNKEEIEPLAKALTEAGVRILSTGGTARTLEELGFEVTQVSDHTGHSEILSGRVKTLHPKIHGGILCRRSLDSDMTELNSNDISPIDYVIVNLYPFREKLAEIGMENVQDSEQELLEFIDIGGPTLLRAAAKNFPDVTVCIDPADYPKVVSHLKGEAQLGLADRRKFAAKVFDTISRYDAAIANYLNSFEEESEILRDNEAILLDRVQELRYGENPHQEAAYYRISGMINRPWHQLQGKELSYNNLADMSAAIELLTDLSRVSDRSKAVVIKHLNPCGVAFGSSPADAFEKARSCDSISAFGGIVCIDGVVDEDCAKVMMEGFLEVVIAEDFTEDAKLVYAQKKNVRLIQCSYDKIKYQKLQYKNIFDGVLVQTRDDRVVPISTAELVCGEALDNQQLECSELAQVVCKHVKSNAIVLAKDDKAIGVGAGQMSRIDSARLSLDRARKFGFDPHGAVAASDAFLPFPDTLEELASAGVNVLIQPGGSMRDKEVISAAEKLGVKMLFTGTRHFRH